MSYYVECDWCGARLAHEDDQAVMPVTIHHRRGKSRLNAQWAEETKQTRHFCAAEKDDDLDRNGRNRMGLLPDRVGESCYDKVIALIEGVELREPGDGLEWRLVPTAGAETAAAEASRGARAPAPALVNLDVDPELLAVIRERLPVARKFALPRAGITTLEQIAGMSDDELLAVPGIGWGILRQLREALAEREGSKT